MLGSGFETPLIVILIALASIVICGRLAGGVAVRYRQPRAVGEISGGILLGIALSALWPASSGYLHGHTGQVLSVMAQIGIVLMMFQVGMEFDFELLKRRQSKRAVFWIVLLGIPIPFLAGMLAATIYAASHAVENRLGLMLICGVAFSITALPILGRILLERNLQNTEAGVITITAAGLNDLLGWIILGAVVVFATGQDVHAIALQSGVIVLFLAVLFFGVRPLLVRYYLKQEHSDRGLSDSGMGLLAGGVLLVGAFTAWLGIFAVVGGFLLGTSLYQCRGLLRQWNQKVTPFVNVVLVPIFFFYTGMKVELSAFSGSDEVLLCIGWVAAGCLSKGLSCALAARIAGLPSIESLRIGVLLNTRALMELVVLNIAHELGLVPQALFSVLVMLALVSTLITAPLLSLLQARRSARAELVSGISGSS
ncbi:cation:proton antiporter [Pseudomonas sp. NCHU5208]|uniref:cation:proton antiporter n=1 Tax=unclassified Pseudomonas TaxID=196821 RepID=UPI003F99C3E0